MLVRVLLIGNRMGCDLLGLVRVVTSLAHSMGALSSPLFDTKPAHKVRVMISAPPCNRSSVSWVMVLSTGFISLKVGMLATVELRSQKCVRPRH